MTGSKTSNPAPALRSVGTATTVRNPDKTRDKILEAAYEEIHLRGFQAASLDAILKKAGVTKGALYHHFPNKKELGYAVVDSYLREDITSRWIDPLLAADDPLSELAALLIRHRDLGEEYIRLGCPLTNLAQEMSALDEGFRNRVNDIFHLWRDSISEAISRGQLAGKVRKDVAPDQASTFIVAALEGSLLLAKNAQNDELLMNCGFALMQYLNTLRTH